MEFEAQIYEDRVSYVLFWVRHVHDTIYKTG